MFNIIFRVVLLFSVISTLCLLLWIYYNQGEWNGHYFYYFHHWCKVKEYMNLNTFADDVPCSNILRSYVLTKFPVSLWHNESREHGHKNDRLQAQRKLLEVLSDIQDHIPIKKILVLKNLAPDTYFTSSEHETPMCPHNLTITEKCNFIRINATEKDIASINIFEYDALINTAETDWAVRKIWNLTSNETEPLHIYYSLESPLYYSSVTLSEHNKVIATYWSNADISLPYGKWINETAPSKFTVFNPTPFDRKKNYAEGKSKMVAWFVKNCKPRNGRMDYALQLRKYIQVDIFGLCSPEKRACNPNCFEMLKTDYKFYLAFENTNCRDYITEKLYRNAFRNDVVPIVMGAHPDDYKAVAPNHSYIHVEDFDSPKSLAQYLLLLNRTNELYNKYFEWRGTGQFIETLSDVFCRVCAMTMYSEFQPMPKWSINSTLQQEDNCLPDKLHYWTRSSVSKS